MREEEVAPALRRSASNFGSKIVYRFVCADKATVGVDELPGEKSGAPPLARRSHSSAWVVAETQASIATRIGPRRRTAPNIASEPMAKRPKVAGSGVGVTGTTSPVAQSSEMTLVSIDT